MRYYEQKDVNKRELNILNKNEDFIKNIVLLQVRPFSESKEIYEDALIYG